MHRMCQRLTALELRQFIGQQQKVVSRRKHAVTQLHSVPLIASYSTRGFGDSRRAESTQSGTLPFAIRHANGARMTGDEFLSKVNETIAKSDTSSAEDSGESAIPRAAVDVLLTEYDSLLEEVAAFKDRYTRAIADTENVRKRGQRLTDEAKTFAIQGFCKDLLEVQ